MPPVMLKLLFIILASAQSAIATYGSAVITTTLAAEKQKEKE